MKKLVTVIAAGLLLSASVRAQEVSALVDALVDKKVLTPAEAERIRASLAKENAETSAGKLKLTDSVTELKLSGDTRLRYQYDQADFQEDKANDSSANKSAKVGAIPNVNQRSRWRFRLRLNADFKLGPNFFGGVGLATGQAADSNMETYTSGFDNYNIFINKAFLGWKPANWLTLIAGKQANPLYTTELVWDADINPQGFVEVIDVGKALFADSPFSLQLIAGQFVFNDNNEFSLDHDLSTDAWLFAEQIKATYNFNKDTSLTVAPGFMTYTAADLNGLRNSRPFSDAAFGASIKPIQIQTITTNAETVAVSYDAKGIPSRTVTPINTVTTVTVTDPAAGTPRTVTSTATTTQKQVRTVGTVDGLPGIPTDLSKANKTFTSTTTLGNGSVVVTDPVVPVSGETRSQTILTAPGDLTFKIAGLKSKFYWDAAYNFNGSERYNQVYGLGNSPVGEHYDGRDALAWLVGFQLGENKKAGDWSLYVNYREIGIVSVDPNLNDSDFALSALNIRGVKTSFQYNFTDWLTASVSYARASNLKKNLIGGQATGGAGLADLNDVDVFQVDVNWKF